MLNAKQVVEGVYQKIFFILLVIQLLVLVITIIVYNINTSYIFQGITSSYEKELVTQTTLFTGYLNDKYNVMLNDLSLLSRYLQATRYYENENPPTKTQITNMLNNEDCWEFSYKVSSNDSFSISKMPSDYSDVRITIDKTRLKFGSWFGRDILQTTDILDSDKHELYSLCKLQSIINEFFYKYVYWSDRFPMQINYFHFSFENTGLFVKYPIEYSSSTDINSDYKDTGRDSNRVCKRATNNYDPRCRPFYIYSYEEESDNDIISFIVPYLFTSGYMGSEICVRNYDLRSSRVDTQGSDFNKITNMLLCCEYNFQDFDLMITLSRNIESNQKLMVVFYKPLISSKPATIYNSVLPSINFYSFGEKLKILVNNKTNYLEPDDLFETLYNPLFEKEYNKILKEEGADSNFTHLKTKYVEMYDFYYDSILKRLVEISNSTNTTNYFSESDITSILRNNTLGFLNMDYTYMIDSSTGLIEKIKNTTYFYFAPITINASLSHDYTIGNYRPAEYFLVFMRTEKDVDQTTDFIEFIGFEFILVFAYMIGLNLIIWSSFNTLTYYCFSAFFMPLKIINRVYKNIFFNNVNEFDKDFNILNGIEEEEKEIDLSSKIQLEKRVMKLLSLIIDLNDYIEIREIKKTLKVLTLIRSNNITKISNLKLSYSINQTEPKLNNIIDALTYLLKDFKSIKIEDNSLDSKFLVDIVYLIFIFMLKNKENLEIFYFHIKSLIESVIEETNTINLKQQQQRKSSSTRKQSNNANNNTNNLNNNNIVENSPHLSPNSHAKSSFRKIIIKDQDEKQLYYCLSEEITFKYLNFKSNNLEILNKNFFKSNNDFIEEDYYLSSKEEDKLLHNPASYKFKEQKRSSYKEQFHRRYQSMLGHNSEFKFFNQNNLNNNNYDNKNLNSNLDSFSSDNEDYSYNSDNNRKENENSLIMSESTYNQTAEQYNVFKRKNKNSGYKKGTNKDVRKDYKNFVLKRKEIDSKAENLIDELELYQESKLKYSHTSIFGIKKATSLLMLANSFQILNKVEDSLKTCVQTIETLKIIAKDIQNKGKLTKFSYYLVTSVIFERVLKIIANVNSSMEKKKSEVFVFLKMMDLSLVYNRSLRNENLQKMGDFIKNTHYLLLKENQAKGELSNVFYNENFYYLKLIKHKLRTITNVSMNFRKNIVFLYDVDFPFIRQKSFRFKHFLKEIFTSSNFSRNSLYFALFNHSNLYVYLENKNDSFKDKRIINVNFDFDKKEESEEESSDDDRMENYKDANKDNHNSILSNSNSKKSEVYNNNNCYDIDNKDSKEIKFDSFSKIEKMELKSNPNSSYSKDNTINKDILKQDNDRTEKNLYKKNSQNSSNNKSKSKKKKKYDSSKNSEDSNDSDEYKDSAVQDSINNARKSFQRMKSFIGSKFSPYKIKNFNTSIANSNNTSDKENSSKQVRRKRQSTGVDIVPQKSTKLSIDEVANLFSSKNLPVKRVNSRKSSFASSNYNNNNKSTNNIKVNINDIIVEEDNYNITLNTLSNNNEKANYTNNVNVNENINNSNNALLNHNTKDSKKVNYRSTYRSIHENALFQLRNLENEILHEKIYDNNDQNDNFTFIFSSKRKLEEIKNKKDSKKQLLLNKKKSQKTHKKYSINNNSNNNKNKSNKRGSNIKKQLSTIIEKSKIKSTISESINDSISNKNYEEDNTYNSMSSSNLNNSNYTRSFKSLKSLKPKVSKYSNSNINKRYKNNNNLNESSDMNSSNDVGVSFNNNKNDDNNDNSRNNVSSKNITETNSFTYTNSYDEEINNSEKTRKKLIYSIPSNLVQGIELTLKSLDFRSEYPKNNNFMFIFTTPKSEFDLTKKSLLRISSIILDTEYTIIIMIYSENPEKDKPFVDKLKYWCENHILNGFVFIINQFTQVKHILHMVNPKVVRFFNHKKMKEFSDIFYDNYNTQIVEERKRIETNTNTKNVKDI